VIPGHHEAAVRQRGDRSRILRPGGRRIDQKLAADLAPICAKDLRLDRAAAVVATETAVVFPRDHKATTCQRRRRGLPLRGACLGVDQEFVTDLMATGVKAL